tara:strand:- start:31121 stop:31936 length:816 start_codon:yes stop_codon:yes gene_type:complete
MNLELFTEPLQYAFMQKALLAIILAGLNCALIGTYVVLRRMAFIGEAFTHTLLPGVVFAYVRGFQLFWGALGAGLLTALSIGWIATHKKVREDTAIGVVLSTMFALGVLMMSFVRSFRDFGSLLFGSLLGITSSDLVFISATTLIILATLRLIHKELELTSFDPDYGQLIGVRPNRLRAILLLLIALSVVSAIQVIGALLTTALLITPAATACLWSKTLSRTMALATSIAITFGIVGLYCSYYFKIASGAAIVLGCSACFLISWLFKKIRT